MDPSASTSCDKSLFDKENNLEMLDKKESQVHVYM